MQQEKAINPLNDKIITELARAEYETMHLMSGLTRGAKVLF